MPSRWAYEAMAVHQVKGNRFSKEFFDIEQTRNNSIYLVDYVTEIQNKLNDVYYDILEGEEPTERFENLALVRNELHGLAALHIVTSFGTTEDLQPGREVPDGDQSSSSLQLQPLEEAFSQWLETRECLANSDDPTCQKRLRPSELAPDQDWPETQEALACLAIAHALPAVQHFCHANKPSGQ